MWDPELKRKWDNQAVLDYAIAEAKSKGKRKAAIEIAGRLKMEGFSIAKIAQFTKLSIEEIEKL